MEEENDFRKREPWSGGKKAVVGLLTIFIAIVLIAGVLYVWVPQDFVPPDVSGTVWALNRAEATSTTTGIIVFGSSTVIIEHSDIVIFVYIDGTAAGFIELPHLENGPATWTDAPGKVCAEYFDYNPAGGQINTGDELRFENLSASTVYTFDLYHIEAASTLLLTGATPYILTPPNPPDFDGISYTGSFSDYPEYESLSSKTPWYEYMLPFSIILGVIVVVSWVYFWRKEWGHVSPR